MIKFIVVIFVGMILFSSQAFAGWGSFGEIQQLRTVGGQVHFMLNGVTGSCGTTQYILLETASSLKQSFAILLAAKISKIKVAGWQTGSCGGNNKTVVDGIKLQD